MNKKILSDNEIFLKRISELKKKSSIYPDLYLEYDKDKIWLSTLVVFERCGKKYSRHHVVSMFRNSPNDEKELAEKLAEDANRTVKFAAVTQFDDLIPSDSAITSEFREADGGKLPIDSESGKGVSWQETARNFMEESGRLKAENEKLRELADAYVQVSKAHTSDYFEFWNKRVSELRSELGLDK